MAGVKEPYGGVSGMLERRACGLPSSIGAADMSASESGMVDVWV